ncbi:MAG: SDR family NAD(P)-dependent oxidoreductase [Acidiferrobacterales bacterium]
MNFSNKAVIVTGASRGIGRAIASEFAQHGARVAIHYHNEKQKAQQTLRSLPGEGHVIVRADFMSAGSTHQLIDKVTTDMGRLDVLVNNAGVFMQGPIAEVSFEEWQTVWRDTLSINLLAPAHLCFRAAQYMAKNGGGRIINISSRGAFRGEPEAPAYGASKAGLNAMSQSLAQSLARDNIYVYTVAPGFVDTDMVSDLLQGPAGEAIRNQSPLGRVARPEEIARTVVFLASEGSEFLTGGIVDVNGASYLRS